MVLLATAYLDIGEYKEAEELAIQAKEVNFPAQAA